jgi:hypothetical protein
MSTRNRKKKFLGSKVRPMLGAETLTAIYEPIGILNVSQPYRPPRPVKGIDLLFLLLHSVNCVDTYTTVCRRVFSSASL